MNAAVGLLARGATGLRAGWWPSVRLAFGPGALVAVGYMDPGNWATDLGAGARYGYDLLAVVLIASLMAMLLQGLSVRLGIATGEDLAQACRRHYSHRTAMILWGFCQVAIVACDMAEIVGAAIALNLLFGIPVLAGVFLGAVGTLLILLLEQHGRRRLESVIVVLSLSSPPASASTCCWRNRPSRRPPPALSLVRRSSPIRASSCSPWASWAPR